MEVEKSAARAAEIANDLGTFSRPEKEQRGQSARNLNAILQRAVELFRERRRQENRVEVATGTPAVTRQNLTRPKSSRRLSKYLENAVAGGQT